MSEKRCGDTSAGTRTIQYKPMTCMSVLGARVVRWAPHTAWPGPVSGFTSRPSLRAGMPILMSIHMSIRMSIQTPQSLAPQGQPCDGAARTHGCTHGRIARTDGRKTVCARRGARSHASCPSSTQAPPACMRRVDAPRKQNHEAGFDWVPQMLFFSKRSLRRLSFAPDLALPDLALPDFCVARFSVARFSIARFGVACD